VEDLDREVLALLTEDLLLCLLENLAGTVMWVDDVVAELELDVLGLTRDLEVLEQCFVFFNRLRDDGLLGCLSARAGAESGSSL
jgi:hypothetical protein